MVDTYAAVDVVNTGDVISIGDIDNTGDEVESTSVGNEDGVMSTRVAPPWVASAGWASAGWMLRMSSTGWMVRPAEEFNCILFWSSVVERLHGHH